MVVETLFISKDARLARRENTLTVTVDRTKRFFPIEKIRHIVLLGEARLNSQLLCLCGTNGVRLSVFDYYGYYKGSFEPKPQNPSGRVIREQARCLLDDGIRMPIAREIVQGAWHNMKANLSYYRYRGYSKIAPLLREMHRTAAKIDQADDTENLMGVEGRLHVLYYAAWKIIDPRLDFGPRVRRPPNNPINCLISFLNQLTYTVTRHEIHKTHLEETLAWLHAPGERRSSLSLDLSEPFKPILADKLIFRLIRKNILADNWFDQKENVCLLTETGRRHVAEHFSVSLEEHYQGRSYREWIYREAMGIERHVMGVAEYASFKRKV
jgi:CRISPR-associated protein Cas1